MGDGDGQLDFTECRIAFDIVDRAKQTADDFAVVGSGFQAGNITLDIGGVIRECFYKLFQSHFVSNHRCKDRLNIHHCPPVRSYLRKFS